MAFKLNSDKVRERSIGKVSKTFKITAILAVIVVVIVLFNFWSSYSLRQTVDIVKLETAVPQDGRVMQDNMVKDKMLKEEYEKQGVYKLSDGSERRSIILWEDRERLKNNAYASYYIRQGTPLYWDALTKETPKKYSYLYKMDGELLKIGLDAEEFGQMLVPGDKINVRASYTETNYTLPSESEFALKQQLGIQDANTVTRNVKLFNSVVVLDILNSKGDSIFDIYYRLLSLPKSKQQEVVATKEFKDTVKPSDILLNVTPEEADYYMMVSGKNPEFLMTLLPRSSGNLITEALNELQIGFARDSN